MVAELAKVIPLFKDIVLDEGEPWSPGDVLTEEMAASLDDVTYSLGELWTARSPEEFTESMASIKEQVAGWPDG